MRHFKLAMIVTATALIVCIVLGIAGVTWIHGSRGNTDKRAEMLGQGLGTLTTLVIAPFWIYGAYNLGKERRAAQSKPRAKTLPRRRTGA
jgi:hypothetical protein